MHDVACEMVDFIFEDNFPYNTLPAFLILGGFMSNDHCHLGDHYIEGMSQFYPANFDLNMALEFYYLHHFVSLYVFSIVFLVPASS